MNTDFDSTYKMIKPGHVIMLDYCDRYGITADVLRSPGRKQPLAQIRQDCMAEIYHKTGLSTTQIGRLLNRDHSTVITGIRASEARQKMNEEAK